MAPRAINEYLSYRMKEADQEMLFQITLGQWVLSTGKGRHNYLDRVNEIWGVKTAVNRNAGKTRTVKQYRPAKEIINDTFARMKIKIKHNEDVTDGCV